MSTNHAINLFPYIYVANYFLTENGSPFMGNGS